MLQLRGSVVGADGKQGDVVVGATVSEAVEQCVAEVVEVGMRKPGGEIHEVTAQALTALGRRSVSTG